MQQTFIISPLSVFSKALIHFEFSVGKIVAYSLKNKPVFPFSDVKTNIERRICFFILWSESL